MENQIIYGDESENLFIELDSRSINEINEEVGLDFFMELSDVFKDGAPDIYFPVRFNSEPYKIPHRVAFFKTEDMKLNYDGTSINPSDFFSSLNEINDLVSNMNPNVKQLLFPYGGLFNRADIYYMNTTLGYLDQISWQRQLQTNSPVAILTIINDPVLSYDDSIASVVQEQLGLTNDSLSYKVIFKTDMYSPTSLAILELKSIEDMVDTNNIFRVVFDMLSNKIIQVTRSPEEKIIIDGNFVPVQPETNVKTESLTLNINTGHKVKKFKKSVVSMKDGQVIFGWGRFGEVINIYNEKPNDRASKEPIDRFVIVLSVGITTEYEKDMRSSIAASSTSSSSSSIRPVNYNISDRHRPNETIPHLPTGAGISFKPYGPSPLEMFKGQRPTNQYTSQLDRQLTYHPAAATSQEPAATSAPTREIMYKGLEYYTPSVDAPLSPYELITILGERVKQLYDATQYQPLVDTFDINPDGTRTQITSPFEIARRELEQCRLGHLSVVRETMTDPIKININQLIPHCRNNTR